MDNVEFITDFMTWYSPLNQVFVMDACHKLAATILNDIEQTRKDMEGNFVNADAWIKCASDFRDKYEENYD